VALTTSEILQAYGRGLFPMGDPLTGVVRWYRPDPRAILPLDGFHCPRRLARTVRSGRFEVVSDRDFEAVIDGCSDREETWITPPIRKAYVALHRKGHAHSVETRRGGRLAGGLYGVRVGGAFMAESMFHCETDAGKVALAGLVEHLKRRGFLLLDIQMMTPLLGRFGAVEVPNVQYQRRLRKALTLRPRWRPFGEVSCQPTRRTSK
jgi:leucyl/phenylalanyl-tRNA--protein transferase